jgi:hypothetical protein
MKLQDVEPVHLRAEQLRELLIKNELIQGDTKITLEKMSWNQKEKLVRDAKLDAILPIWGTPACEALIKSGKLATYVREKSKE